jgi:hypothetical protein
MSDKFDHFYEDAFIETNHRIAGRVFTGDRVIIHVNGFGGFRAGCPGPNSQGVADRRYHQSPAPDDCSAHPHF